MLLLRDAAFKAHGWLTFLSFAVYALFGAVEMCIRRTLAVRAAALRVRQPVPRS